MERFLVCIPAEQKDALELLARQTGYPMADTVRRLLDSLRHEEVRNELYPQFSGQLR